MKARGMGSVYLRGRIWWFRYSHRGRSYRESSRSTQRSTAVRLLKQRLGEIGQGRFAGLDPEKVTFGELMELLVADYVLNGRRSLRRTESSRKRLQAFFGDMRAVEITPDNILRYIRSRQKDTPPAAPASIRLELSALKRAFNLALRAGRLHARPYIPSIEVSNVRKGFFEADELRRVLARLPTDLRAVVRFCYLTGWRRGEVLSLTWDQVDLEARCVRLEPGTTKNDEGRTFPFTTFPALAELLTERRAATDEVEAETGRRVPWVFHRRGKPIVRFDAQWKRATKHAGVPGRLLHDLRRTAVRNLERAGVPRSVAMKLTGHKTEAIYRRYAIVSEADLSDGIKKLAATLPIDLKEPQRFKYAIRALA